MLEQMSHGDSLWVTMTYDDINLPNPPNVQKKEIQKYLKKLRKLCPPFRYFIIGEYGDKTWRPHYHGCFFGLSRLYSDVLFYTWGNCERNGFFIGELNEKTAQYTAGYTTQKLTKRRDFVENGLEPEFMLSSRKGGGIGYPTLVQIANAWKNSNWFDKRIIRELQGGKIERPLGRYLTTKLNELLHIPQSKLDAEYWLHQEEIFNQHMRGDGLDYIQSIVDEDKQKYHRAVKRHTMWKNRRL